jgi:nucleotide-binding universal stress UspA family protein
MAHPDPERLAARFAEIGIELTTAVEYGVTSSVLLESSADASLLVLGTRGLGGFGRLVVGSVSHQCATHARIPVAIIPPAASIAGGVKRVVVGMDRSAGAVAALGWANEFAPSGATIQVVGAWQPSSWEVSIDLYSQAADHDEARAEFDAVVDELEASQSNVTFERHFPGGHPADVLLDAADGADVLVVGERGHRGIKAALLGSTATEVLHRAELTTVIVPVPGDEG